MSSLCSLNPLRCTAMVLADHGWPVLHGTYFHDGRWHGRPGSGGLRPIEDDWTETWTTDPAEASRRWGTAPYSVLLACGKGVDCLELPVRCAARMLGALAAADLFAPAMVTPDGGLILFARTDRRSGFLVSATLRSVGTWVGMPPTGRLNGVGDAGYQWVPGMSPDRLNWALPELPALYEVVAATASRRGAQ